MTPPDVELEPLAATLERLVLWMRRQTPSHVSSSTITALDTLLHEGPLRISQLAERESISQPGMTTLVNRLEAAGQAERFSDPSDGRVALVRITDAGADVLARRRRDRTNTLIGELARLDPDDQAALLAALPAVRRLIEARRHHDVGTGKAEKTPKGTNA